MNINKIRNKLEKKASLNKIAGPLSKFVKEELSVIKDLLKNRKYDLSSAVDTKDSASSLYYHLKDPIDRIHAAIGAVMKYEKKLSPSRLTKEIGQLSRSSYDASVPGEYQSKTKFYERLSSILENRYERLRYTYGSDLANYWKWNIIKKYFDM